jgi:hypothetical protein
MRRDGSERNYGPIIGAVMGMAVWGIWYVIDFLIWQKKPSQYELQILAVAGCVIYCYGEIKERLRQIESRLDELENQDLN